MNGMVKAGRITAVGLDLGHTLMFYEGVPMSWQSLYPEALRAAFAAICVQPDEAELREACERLGRYNTRIHPRETEYSAQLIFADVLGVADKCMIERAVDAFFGRIRQNYTVYGDAVSFLKRMRAAGIPCGVLTDVPYGMPSRWVEKDAEPFRPWLAAVLSSVDVGFRKPNAAGFRALAGLLGAEPARMAYFGDERKDIEGARAAGMTAVLLDRDGTLPDFGEHLRIRCFDEFINE